MVPRRIIMAEEGILKIEKKTNGRKKKKERKNLSWRSSVHIAPGGLELVLLFKLSLTSHLKEQT